MRYSRSATEKCEHAQSFSLRGLTNARESARLFGTAGSVFGGPCGRSHIQKSGGERVPTSRGKRLKRAGAATLLAVQSRKDEVNQDAATY